MPFLPPDLEQATLQNGVWVVQFQQSNVMRTITLFTYYNGPPGSTVTAYMGTTPVMTLARGDLDGWEFITPLPLPAGQIFKLQWNSGAGSTSPIATLYTLLATEVTNA